MKRTMVILSPLLIALVLTVGASVAGADTSASPEPSASASAAWAPVQALIGSWTGVKATPEQTAKDGASKFTRKYETASNSKNVQVNDRNGNSSWQVAGIISLDAERGNLVLSHLGTDGRMSDLVLEPGQSSETRLVFTGVHDNPGQLRVTYERLNWNEFVERVEYAPQGQGFSLVSETRFKRKG